jgi:hypothetical protein
MSQLNFELNIQNYSLSDLINVFQIQKFEINNIKKSVSDKVSRISVLDLSNIEKKEIIYFLKTAEYSLLKDLEIMELKLEQNKLFNEIELLKKNNSK